MEDNKLYITRLMYAECSLGSMKNKLNLPRDHGVVYGDKDHPVMNANDYIGGQHIVHFGRCTSDKNPGNKVSMESVVMNALIPGSTMIKKLIGCDGCKCKPLTLTPWINIHKKHTIDGAPALLLESTATCYYGGTIRILKEEPAEQTEQSEAGEETEKKHILEYLPSSMQDKINDFCSQPDVDASAEGATAAAAEAAAIGSAMAGGGGAFAGGGGGALPAGPVPAGSTRPAAGAAPAYGTSMAAWTDWGIPFGMAGVPGLNFTPEMSLQNLVHNRSQMLPPGAFDHLGNLAGTGALDCFNIGATVLSAVDPGCSAVFNVLNMMGISSDLADIIFHFEQYALSNFLPVGGPLVTSAAAMVDYLTSQELNVMTMLRTGAELNGLRQPPSVPDGLGRMSGRLPAQTADVTARPSFLPEQGIAGTFAGGTSKPVFQAVWPAVSADRLPLQGEAGLAPAKPQLMLSLQKK